MRLIDADEVKHIFVVLSVKHYGSFTGDAFVKAVEVLENAPAVDAVEVVHGRWIGSGQWNHKPYRMRNKEKWQTYLCSECGHSNGRRFNDKYCPNCGAKMDLK